MQTTFPIPMVQESSNAIDNALDWNILLIKETL